MHVTNPCRRIGRTARDGNDGVSYTIFTNKDAIFAGPRVKILQEANQVIWVLMEILEYWLLVFTAAPKKLKDLAEKKKSLSAGSKEERG